MFIFKKTCNFYNFLRISIHWKDLSDVRKFDEFSSPVPSLWWDAVIAGYQLYVCCVSVHTLIFNNSVNILHPINMKVGRNVILVNRLSSNFKVIFEHQLCPDDPLDMFKSGGVGSKTRPAEIKRKVCSHSRVIFWIQSSCVFCQLLVLIIFRPGLNLSQLGGQKLGQRLHWHQTCSLFLFVDNQVKS